MENELPCTNHTIANSEVGRKANLHWLHFFTNLAESPRGSFVGSCRGDISVQVIDKGGTSHVKITYAVTNTTSLKSLFAQLLPDLEYSGPMGNWTQIYTWTEEVPCCNN
jgi:hypothetical protein